MNSYPHEVSFSLIQCLKTADPPLPLVPRSPPTPHVRRRPEDSLDPRTKHLGRISFRKPTFLPTAICQSWYEPRSVFSSWFCRAELEHPDYFASFKSACRLTEFSATGASCAAFGGCAPTHGGG